MALRKHVTLTRLLMVLTSVSAPLTPALAQNSGKVGAVNQGATGTAPGESPHALVVGLAVVHKESIKTSPEGSTQILFPDQSTLNVGRNSSVVIDDYAYDPKTGTGTMLASINKGALRFVGGQISHTAGVSVGTSVALLGIRGGTATVVFPITPAIAASDPNLAGCSGELVIGHVGTVILKNKVSEVTIRPGFAACVNAQNVPINPPFRVSDGVLAHTVSMLRSGPGQSGGAATRPAAQLIEANGVGRVILDDPAHPPGADPLGLASIFSGGDSIVRNRAQTRQLNGPFFAGPGGGGPILPPPPPPPPPPPITSDIRLKRDIHLLATFDSGMKIYSFKYFWSDATYVGVMAQDLLVNPMWADAVVISPDGFYAVNYGALGLNMVKLEEWQSHGLASLKGAGAATLMKRPQAMHSTLQLAD